MLFIYTWYALEIHLIYTRYISYLCETFAAPSPVYCLTGGGIFGGRPPGFFINPVFPKPHPLRSIESGAGTNEAFAVMVTSELQRNFFPKSCTNIDRLNRMFLQQVNVYITFDTQSGTKSGITKREVSIHFFTNDPLHFVTYWYGGFKTFFIET